MTEVAQGFGKPFQEALVAQALHFTDVLSLCYAYVPLDYFDSTVHAHLMGIAYNYYDAYKAVPTRTALIELVSDDAESGRISSPEVGGYAMVLERLLTRDNGDRNFVRDRLTDFIRQQATADAIVASVDFLKEGRYDDIRAEMKRALTAGDLTMGHLYGEGVDARIARRNRLDDEGVATLIPGLDRALHGGLRRKELGVLMGPPGRGKSVGLNHMSKAGLVLNEVVSHYTLEMGEDRIADRLDSTLSGVPHRELADNASLVRRRLSRLVKPRSLVIKEWPTKKATPDTIRAHMDNMIGSGMRPTMIVVDYGDILAPTRRYGEKRHEEASNFEELRAIAVEYNLPVWTATQANRASLNKETIRMDDIAESFEKCAIADVILGICQTDDELEASQLRLYIAKNRDNPAGFTVGPFYCDFDRMSFYVKEDPRERGRYRDED